MAEVRYNVHAQSCQARRQCWPPPGQGKKEQDKNSCHHRDEAMHLVICRKLLQLYSIVPDPLAVLVLLELP